MKCINIIVSVSSLFFPLISCVKINSSDSGISPIKTNELKQNKIPSEKDDRKYRSLAKYADLELSAPTDKLTSMMTEKYGKFQIPWDVSWRDYACPARYIMGALRTLWFDYDDKNAREKYILIAQYILSNLEKMSDKELLSKINDDGTKNPWHLFLKEAAYQYARLYEVSGKEKYARRSCLLLERFSEVVDNWQIHYQYWDNRLKPGSYTIGNKPIPIHVSDGLWGHWGNVHDLVRAEELITAYSLITSSLSFKELSKEQQKKITDMFHVLVKKHFLFPFRPGHNQNMSRIKGLIRFGTVLNEPAYFHQAYRWLKDMINIPYRADGFWCEGTLSYGYPMTTAIIQCSELLEGYSDPPGYIDPVDGKHFDKLSVKKEFEKDFERIKYPFDLLTLPNGRPLALEDTEWDATNFFFENPMKTETTPFLLGASGIGMMGFGKEKDQVRLYFHFDGTHGHDHYDCLGISLWACNQEISSETAYRGLRDWNKSTAAHNTVVIDEKDQYTYHQGVEKKEALQSAPIPLYPQYTYEHVRGGVYSDNSGRLVLWDTNDPELQIAEVDGINSYKYTVDVKEYRRTLCLVRVDEKHFYMVDIFRVKGGKTHDWMFHGNFEKKYEVKITGTADMPSFIEKKGVLCKYMDNLRALPYAWNKNVIADFCSEDGAILRTIIAGSENTDVIVADGPAIRLAPSPDASNKVLNDKGKKVPWKPTEKKSQFLCIRRSGSENIFVAVHEAYKKDEKPIVRDIELLKVKSQNSLDVGIKVKLENREDIFISSTDTNSNMECENISFGGNFLHAVTEKGNVKKIRVYGAEKLSWDKFHLDKPTILKGAVHSIESKNRGNKNNSFTVEGTLPENDKLKGSTIIIYDGQKRPHPYIISEIENLSDGKSKVLVDNETGFIMDNESMTMLYCPCWKIPGKPSYLIRGKHVFIPEG